MSLTPKEAQPAEVQAQRAQTSWARLIMAALEASGVGDLVLSPGSRSTPFVLAALRTKLRIHDVIDERAAGFFALGLARETGIAPLLLCTSGTAAGHYLPAVMEASAAHIPLLVLSADRPIELHGSGANQTIDQTRLFGGHVRRFIELGEAHASTGAMRGAARHAVQACAATRDPLPGPVHLNARLRKPLEPLEAEGDPAPAALPITHVSIPRRIPDTSALAQVAKRLSASRRPMFVAGPAAVSQGSLRAPTAQVAERLGAPIVADITSQLQRTLPVGALQGLDPDLIIQLGRPPIASAYERYLAALRQTERIVMVDHGWPDPSSSATQVVLGALNESVRSLAELISDDERPAWKARWTVANDAHDARLTRVYQTFGPTLATEQVLQSVGPDETLFVGNSLCARLVDRVRAVPRRVLHQRGVSGIDGLVAGAAGAASTGRRTTLLLGDISLLHDISSLRLASPLPLSIVVLNDGGGRIFERLPIHRELASDAFEAHFATAHETRFEHAAALGHVDYAPVVDRDTLGQALEIARERPGATLIEVVVDPARARDEDSEMEAS